MKALTKVVLSASLLILLGVVAIAQNPSPAPAPAPAAASFSTRSELVLVPVLVTDGSGAHVSGLKKDDFVVKENGKAQHVTVFEEVKALPPTRDAKKPSLAPGVFSNVQPQETPRRLVIVALDTANTPFADQAYARQQIVKFLSESIDPGSMIALVAVGRGRMRMIHDFTTDPALLVAALRKVRGEPDTGIQLDQGDADAFQNEMDVLQDFVNQSPREFMAGAMRTAVAGEQRIAVLDTLASIQQLARAYAGVPGRKALVWATAGFPFTIGDSDAILQDARGVPKDGIVDILPDYEKTWQVLNDANMAVYPVDVRGLVVTSVLPASVGGRGGPRAVRNQMQRQQLRFRDTIDTMNAFADMTGGKAFYNTNDLSHSFRRASDDSAAYYLLGYYLDRGTKPGWQKLKVEVQHHGVHVRARSGFFVTANTQEHDITHKRDIALAMGSPLDFTGMPMTVQFTGTKRVPNALKRTVTFNVILPPNSVTVDEADSNHMQVEFVGMARTHEGRQVTDFVQTVEGHVKPETVADMRVNGMLYDYKLELPPGDYSIRFVVRDSISGRLGSVTAPLQVR